MKKKKTLNLDEKRNVIFMCIFIATMYSLPGKSEYDDNKEGFATETCPKNDSIKLNYCVFTLINNLILNNRKDARFHLFW